MTVFFPQVSEFSALLPPRLAPNQIHLMVASLESLTQHREQVFSVIDQTEQTRAERFINPTHGDNFRLVRGTLRILLAAYLKQNAKDIHFDFNEHGKPLINPSQNPQALQFNVSHSHDMAAFVFTMQKPVGIDIEHIKPLNNISGLAQHVCHPKELDEFNAMEAHARQDAFFRLWTRKEAFIKAKGQGLSMGLRSIYIGFDMASAIQCVEYRGKLLADWRVKSLQCDPNYKLAAAVEV
ncbi:MAG: hypothetical protein AMJ53_00460 [Gammaproteobacteria bacterium SG8_11]|nr:MAG: hypothetical protein AMJ53_00460 [Gammaproteobacteria bacterium SG8_11]